MLGFVRIGNYHFYEMTEIDKKAYTSKIKCPHCGNIAPMERVARYSTVCTQSDSDDTGEHSWDWDEGEIYRLLCCQGCGKVVLQRDYYDSRYVDYEDNAPETFMTLYPQPDTMPKVLPHSVKSEYEAAIAVKPISANAYAVLLGRVFDIVCEDRKASGKTLSERLADLAAKGEIPKPLAEMAHGLRQLRNVGAHADLGTLTQDEIQLLDAILRAILEYLYRAPRLVEEVRQMLAKRKPSPAKTLVK